MGLSKHGYQAAAARRAGEEAERPFCGLSLEKFWTALSCSMFMGHEKMGMVAKHDAFLVTFVQHLLAPSASVVDPKYRDSRSMGQWGVFNFFIGFIHLSISGWLKRVKPSFLMVNMRLMIHP